MCRVITAVAQLPRDAKNILPEQFLCRRIFLAGGHIEHDKAGGVDLHAVSEDIDNAALGNFALQAVQELCPLQVALPNAQLLHRLGLGRFEETEQPCFVDGVFAVVVLVRAFFIAVFGCEPLDDEGF